MEAISYPSLANLVTNLNHIPFFPFTDNKNIFMHIHAMNLGIKCIIYLCEMHLSSTGWYEKCLLLSYKAGWENIWLHANLQDPQSHLKYLHWLLNCVSTFKYVCKIKTIFQATCLDLSFPPKCYFYTSSQLELTVENQLENRKVSRMGDLLS